MPLSDPTLREVWSQLQPLWRGLERTARFTLLDVLLHLLMRGEHPVETTRMAALLDRDEAVVRDLVDRLVDAGLVMERGQVARQRFVGLNPHSDLVRWTLRLVEVLASTRELRVQFMKLLADDVALQAAPGG